MISVIVPVYNVASYLAKCLDSILAQTYQNLEILVIDDGSTDGSGDICDRYAEKDRRIRIFHTGNRGLSNARNLGLDNARGEYVGFVDSDDWIEPDMYETLLEKAKESNSNITECGAFWEYANTTVTKNAFENTVVGSDAVIAFLNGEIWTSVWNKIYEKSLFENVRFPSGRDFEDIATTYKVVLNARVTSIEQPLYHFRQRKSSISHSRHLKNLVDYWLAYQERYEYLKEDAREETTKALLKQCAYAIARVWAWYLKNDEKPEFVAELSAFVRKNYPRFGFQEWPFSLRAFVFLARFNNHVSFTIAYVLNQMRLFLKPRCYD